MQEDNEPLSKYQMLDIEGMVIEALSTCYDPEIPVNILELGLVYDIKVEPTGLVEVKMTLTTPNCPEAVFLPVEVENKIRAVEGVNDVHVEIVWDPPWGPDRMSEPARLLLGFF